MSRRPHQHPRPAFVPFVEGLLGHGESANGGWHTAVENHLGKNLGYLHLGHAHVQGAQDVPFHQLRTVAEDRNSGYGAETAGLQIHRWPVVDLTVYHGIDQVHYLGG